MRTEITPEEVGDRYGVAVDRMLTAIVEHAEDNLYNADGSPRMDPAEVAQAVDALITILRHEASLIKDTVQEAFELNHAIKSQKELF